MHAVKQKPIPSPFKVPDLDQIFVFGSNIAGIHGSGAAADAVRLYGAIYGQGYGRQGRAYAIPTKDENIQTLPLQRISHFVMDFITVAYFHPETRYFVTRIGCGLAGYRDVDIAPMFVDAPKNCELPDEWLPIIERSKPRDYCRNRS